MKSFHLQGAQNISALKAIKGLFQLKTTGERPTAIFLNFSPKTFLHYIRRRESVTHKSLPVQV